MRVSKRYSHHPTKGETNSLTNAGCGKRNRENIKKEGDIRMVEKTSDEDFIRPVVVTVKKDTTVKIALDARSLNNTILKEKYQMPNFDNLMEQVAEIINS